jgi:hypothetical protein
MSLHERGNVNLRIREAQRRREAATIGREETSQAVSAGNTRGVMHQTKGVFVLGRSLMAGADVLATGGPTLATSGTVRYFNIGHSLMGGSHVLTGG